MEFKMNDRVVITNQSSTTYGMLGTVTKVFQGLDVLLDTDCLNIEDGEDPRDFALWYHPDELEIVS
ncbi:hypothetical protein [Robertmurraya sp.]|uniref:hypothetical protein n=1 Tax=Robertmurraya sp. TaxID=2837525 RepID=UPI0037041E60